MYETKIFFLKNYNETINDVIYTGATNIGLLILTVIISTEFCALLEVYSLLILSIICQQN